VESFALTKNSNFKDIEDAFKTVEEIHSLRLRLPNNLQEAGVFGLEGLVCQLLATWLRNNKNGNLLHSYATKAEKEEFEDLSSSLYGICALRLADKILLSNKSEVDENIALAIAFDRVKKVISGNFGEAFKGLYVAIPSIKSIGINREFNNPFYNNEKVIGMEAFRRLTYKALDVVVPQSGRSSFIDGLKGNIAEIVRELFDNAHKHARENESGDILATNFRGVIFNSVNVTPERLEKLIRSGGGDLTLFTSEWRKWMDQNSRQLPVLDITVVDAGPGYARRWTGKGKDELTMKDEVDAVVKCFVKNNSTSSNDADGSGLTHVLTDLRRLRGWFRLRTGAVAVSRSYFDGKGDLVIKASDIAIMKSHVEGVSFNIVIPLVDITKGVAQHA
jgi:hypothetical protein